MGLSVFGELLHFLPRGLADRFGNVKVVIAGTFLYALGLTAAILHWLMSERPVERLAPENP